MVFDSSSWTGRKPRFPKFSLYWANRFFMFSIGRDWMYDAYTVRFAAVENKARLEGQYFYKVNKAWWLVTAHQVRNGYF